MGRDSRTAVPSTPSSAGLSSPPSSVVEEPVPGPSSWCLRLPLPRGPPSEPLPPNIHELLSGILAHLSSAFPLPCAQSSAPPLVADHHPATQLPLSSLASQPYGVDSSPVSDALPSEEELELEVLPESWAPVPPDWQVYQVAGSVILLRRDEAVPVLGQEACWGTSCHSPLPSWHFRPLSQATQPSPTLPLPTVDELSRSLSVLSLFAGLSPSLSSEDRLQSPRLLYFRLGTLWTPGWESGCRHYNY
ncbi:hypothetical protein E2C01_071557 [Portunus trituberculatus]|uniref:Uncharacterized protein n=1 Tax=Portunus trituberculatus TaxID=210409 RepID=A0A5B7I085_PORTR|nr:hypothetical protein [Portunus trituberculatus]